MSRLARALLLGSLLTVTSATASAEEPPPPPKHMKSPGLVAGGVVLTSVGGIALSLATAIAVLDLGVGGGHYRGLATVVFGVPLLVGGLGCLGGGIPMIVIGGKSITDASPTAIASMTWTF